jgi:hypothetical protein
MLSQEDLVRLARYFLDEIAEQLVSGVTIREPGSRIEVKGSILKPADDLL